LSLERLHLRVERVVGESGRHEREPSHTLGLLHRHPQRDTAAERVSEHIDLRKPELLHERRHVVTDRLEPERTLAEGSAPMPLQIDGNHEPIRRELRQQGPEHVDRPEPSVEQQ
jgi:hypothetical protein